MALLGKNVAPSLQTYRARVDRMIRERTGKPIFNGSLDHAAIIIERMFAHAKHEMRILTHNLHPRAYAPDETLEQAGLFLAESDKTLQILLESVDPIELRIHPFLRRFGRFPNVEIRHIPPGLIDIYNYHMTLMDEDSYRFEGDRSKPVAVAVFGDIEGAENLQKIYARLWERSDPVEVPEGNAEVELVG